LLRKDVALVSGDKLRGIIQIGAAVGMPRRRHLGVNLDNA
ncbi:hypothetical protein EVAR_84137_1, partial [Eumeta japonica]